MNDKYVFFYGGPFSQWYESRFYDENGTKFCTAEQYMMARKALHFGDEEMYNAIMRTQNPSEQKALGRKVRKFDAAEWNEVCREVVFRGNLFKFSQNEGLRKYLLDTEDKIIVEASPTDTIWGIGLSQIDPRRFDESQWRGKNWLGIAIMQVREVFRRQT